MQIRPPAVSGSFYPSDPTILALQVDRFLDEHGAVTSEGRVVGLIAPHAGYMFSGVTAGAAYAVLRSGSPVRTAVIIAPSHREYFNGISIYDGDAYRTPLGIVEIDTVLRERLLAHRGAFLPSKFGHRSEHAVEVQIPFLQRINEDIRIVPIVMGDQRRELCLMLGTLLSQEIDNDTTVLIASSDLSHMYSDAAARELDAVAAEDITAFSAARMLQDLADGRTEACGGGPVCAVMHASRQLGATTARILHQCTSGDVTGDRTRVVGYLAAGLFASEKQPPLPEAPGD